MTPSHPFSAEPSARASASLSHPWLESVSVRGDEQPKNKASEPPVRFVCQFNGNGYHSKEWWAKREGAKIELGRVLDPL